MANGTPNRRVLDLGQVSVDLVILTVLPEEYAAALSCLSEIAPLRGTRENPNTYAWRLGSIWSSTCGSFSISRREPTRAGAWVEADCTP